MISPHVDDEVLGAFAFLGPDTHVLYAGVEDRPSIDIRLAEMEASATALGFSHESLDMPVNNYEVAALIQPLENVLNARRPNLVLLPEPSYNQDHRAVHDASLVVTRPHDANWRVPKVLIYEQPHSVMWRHGPPAEPQLFVPIDIEAKIAAYSRYASQVRGHRSPDVVRALATIRGGQIGVPAAEAFHVKRFVWEVPT